VAGRSCRRLPLGSRCLAGVWLYTHPGVTKLARPGEPLAVRLDAGRVMMAGKTGHPGSGTSTVPQVCPCHRDRSSRTLPGRPDSGGSAGAGLDALYTNAPPCTNRHTPSSVFVSLVDSALRGAPAGQAKLPEHPRLRAWSQHGAPLRATGQAAWPRENTQDLAMVGAGLRRTC